MNVFLVGLMGGGKTTVGRNLARRLGYHFLDMDKQIQHEQNRKIFEIFEQNGEETFRKLETQLLKRLLFLQNTVVATGGGVVIKKENIDLMKKIGVVIYLKTPIEELIKRVKNSSHRPLLNTGDPAETIRTLLIERTPFYEQADHIIETQNFSPKRITSIIIQSL